MTEVNEKLAILDTKDLITQHTLADDLKIIIRPVRLEDADIIKVFSQNLSDELKHLNYMESFKQFPADMMRRLTHVDYKKNMTLIATRNIAEKEQVIGIASYISIENNQTCEFDVIVADAWQNKGIGTLLTKSLMKTAKKNGINMIKIFILASNLRGMKLAKNFEFSVSNSDDPTVRVLTKKLEYK